MVRIPTTQFAPGEEGERMALNGRPRALELLILASVVLLSGHMAGDTPSSSLLLLIDASGSMGEEVGGGNSEIKIEAAKSAALLAVQQAAQKGNVEVAVLAFEGDCTQSVSRHAGFTTDFVALSGFINGLQPGGGTPMAEAVLFANRFMKNESASSARDQMIVLLADGQNDCGSVSDALAELKASGVIFRHETVGFGIQPNSAAAGDLRSIATASGGGYHHASNATQLGDLFMEFVNTFTVIDMLGMFGAAGPASTDARRQTEADTGRSSAASTQTAQGEMAGLLGRFRQRSSATVPGGQTPTLWGALAIDSLKGSAWGWGVDYETLQGAEERVLRECRSESCHVVMTFTNQCGALAADQTEGSTVYGWAKGSDAADTRARALARCSERGGTSCLIRAWGCTTRR